MTTPVIRCYTVLSTAVFAVWAALALNYFSGQYHRSTTVATGSLSHVQTFELKTITGQVDRAAIEFNLSYDLREVFDWSTNVIFLYVTANYETPKHPINELIIYDKVIENREDAYEPGSDIVSKYYMVDYGRSLRETRVTLRLCYCFVPIGGLISSHQLAETRFTMPSDYVL
ncbi:Signal peptidase complex subunit 3 [Babesia sp. Xinjiang]|uniref:Signal peptidase complex subunit 3 n=1 Tax=Babesia sp. Xinjiang TaxID=462227 RepID=UPI000A23D4C5|nr:Signal peptidase complex subunit 3 [Babesia sp. Xinjiang]ORM41075.1 Signal peptidase complex subunit 3 [Babesia sp. Xinjiang]